MAGQNAPLDRQFMEAELEAHAKKRGPSNRTQLLTCLRAHLDAAKAELSNAFYDNNDGAVYVGMYAWTIDILLQLLLLKPGNIAAVAVTGSDCGWGIWSR